jgi:hypothetical protein
MRRSQSAYDSLRHWSISTQQSDHLPAVSIPQPRVRKVFLCEQEQPLAQGEESRNDSGNCILQARSQKPVEGGKYSISGKAISDRLTVNNCQLSYRTPHSPVESLPLHVHQGLHISPHRCKAPIKIFLFLSKKGIGQDVCLCVYLHVCVCAHVFMFT